MTRDLDFKAVVSGRCKRAEKAVYTVLPLLRAQSVPLALRVSVLRTVVLSTLLCGSEIRGVSDILCKPAQVTVNQAPRAVTGHKGGDTAQPCAAVWRELGVPPVCATAAARRARAIRKFPGLKTRIGTLGQYNRRNQRQAWMARSRVWLKKNGLDGTTDGGGDQEQSRDNEEKESRSVINKRWTDCEQKAEWKAASGIYLDSGFAKTTWASLKDTMCKTVKWLISHCDKRVVLGSTNHSSSCLGFVGCQAFPSFRSFLSSRETGPFIAAQTFNLPLLLLLRNKPAHKLCANTGD